MSNDTLIHHKSHLLYCPGRLSSLRWSINWRHVTCPNCRLEEGLVHVADQPGAAEYKIPANVHIEDVRQRLADVTAEMRALRERMDRWERLSATQSAEIAPVVLQGGVEPFATSKDVLELYRQEAPE